MKATKKLRGACYKSKLYLRRSSPTILTCVAAIGVIATSVMAVKATPKAMRLLEDATDEKGEDLTKLEAARVAGPTYIPAIAVGLSTISCIFSANVLNKRQQASIMSAYALIDGSCKEYKNKVKELFGEGGENEIRKAIVKDKYKEGDVEAVDGALLFFDEWSGRYFNRTMEEIQEAEYHLNRNFILRGYTDLNEFYEFLGLPATDLGATIGWSVGAGTEFYGYQWIDFEHELIVMDDGLECYIINIPFGPTADFADY